MPEMLFWIYLINSILLINHEIDSAYWKEWNLFRLLLKQGVSSPDEKRDIAGFLILHFPLLFLILYGLVEVFQNTFAGLMLSLLLSFGGIFAFTIHMYFIKKGRNEFKTPISLFILIATLVVSITQMVITINSLVT